MYHSGDGLSKSFFISLNLKKYSNALSLSQNADDQDRRQKHPVS